MNAPFASTVYHRHNDGLAGRTILQVAPSLAGSPADNTVMNNVAALADAGARPLVAGPPGRLVRELQAIGGIWIDFASRTRNPLAMAVQSRRLRRICRQEQVDLVHALSRRSAWMALGAVRNTGIALVSTVNEISASQSVFQQRFTSVIEKGQAVIAGSSAAAQTIATSFPSLAGRIHVVRPGVDLKAFEADTISAARVHALRVKWGMAPDDRIIVLAAEPSVWKGHKVLLEAVKQLRDSGFKGLRLAFVGPSGGAFGRELDAAARTFDLGSAIVRASQEDDLPAALLAASAVVVPSLDSDQFGKVAVQAQAVGTPVVVSDVGSLAEIVRAPPDCAVMRRSGWRAAPGDPRALAEALTEILNLGASGRDLLGMRARRFVTERFSLERSIADTLAVYASTIAVAEAPL